MMVTAAATTLRETLRRRTALLFVFLLPMVFYLVRIDVHWQAIRFLAIGVGWAVATLSLFGAVSARHLDRRLAVAGASPTALFAGRQLALAGIGIAVAAAYFVLVAATLGLPETWAAGLMLATTALVGVPLGVLVGHAVGRELEGALALLSIMAVQLLVDPDGALAKLLPLWSTRELSAYAIGAEAGTAIGRGMLHFAVTLTACLTVAWAASVLRNRPLRIPAPGSGLRPET